MKYLFCLIRFSVFCFCLFFLILVGGFRFLESIESEMADYNPPDKRLSKDYTGFETNAEEIKSKKCQMVSRRICIAVDCDNHDLSQKVIHWTMQKIYSPGDLIDIVTVYKKPDFPKFSGTCRLICPFALLL